MAANCVIIVSKQETSKTLLKMAYLETEYILKFLPGNFYNILLRKL